MCGRFGHVESVKSRSDIMKILQTQTLQGPNYWSICHPKLIVVRLDLEELTSRSAEASPEFYQGLLEVLPSLGNASGSTGDRLESRRYRQKDTTMAYRLEQVALELQTLADMPVSFGCTCETATPGIYQVVIEYQNEAAGRYAIRAARRLCESILDTGTYRKTELQKDLEDLRDLRAEASLGSSTNALTQEAETLGIPWIQLETCDLFQFGYGKYQKRVQASLTCYSNILGVELACDKERTKNLLASMGVPVPLGRVVYAFRELEDAINRLGGYPIVIKPLDGNHGRGITIDIKSWRQAKVAYDRARDISRGVIVEHFYQGRDHRILVVNHRVVAVAERVPAHVIGDGIATIATLVKQENKDERRGKGHENTLTQIELDDSTDEMLSRQGYTLNTVLPLDQICYLRATANLSTGGIAIDRTDTIHPENIWLAERVSRIIDLDVVGLDVLTTDITQPLGETDGVIVEVNAAPGLRMHIAPSQGVGRNVAAPILNMLFPPGTPTRIPIVAVTGTNGKTTPTPLIAHIFSQVYDAVGFTTADGVYISNHFIGNHLVEKRDPTGLKSAQMILQDPTVDLAILETAREDILQSGLAFPQCDVGVVLNVAADQLDSADIKTIEQMARVNAVIPGVVHPTGYAVLNADDERVAAMAGQVVGKVAYFSLNPDNPLVRSHVQQGGVAAIYDQNYLTILQQDWVHRIEKVNCISFTLGGCTPFMMANALAASLTAFVLGVNVEQIRAALHSFKDPSQQTLGQMSLFNDEYYHCDLLNQYADFKDVPTTAREDLLPQLAPLQQLSDRVVLDKAQQQEEKAKLIAQKTSSIPNNYAAKGLFSASQEVLTQLSNGSAKHLEPRIVSLDHYAHTTHFPAKSEATPDLSIEARDSSVSEDQTSTQSRIKTWAANRSRKATAWVKAQTPIVKQVILNTAQKIAEQASEKGEVIGAIAVAFGSRIANAVFEKSIELGAIAFEKFEKATQLVDPAILNPALKDVIDLFGKNGRAEDDVFDYQQTSKGVDVHLKDGTPIYTNSKLNLHVDTYFSLRLNKIPGNVAEVKAKISQQLTPQNFQKHYLKVRR
jgi:cyanophycin synthetase